MMCKQRSLNDLVTNLCFCTNNKQITVEQHCSCTEQHILETKTKNQRLYDEAFKQVKQHFQHFFCFVFDNLMNLRQY